jgi:hypothetical protein
LRAVSRSAVVLAAMAIACLAAVPAWAGSSCKVGLARAGVLDTVRVRAISASLAPLSAPQLQNGYATAWVGVGRGSWIHVGIRSASMSEPSQLFYETNNAARGRKMTLFDRWVHPGDRVTVSLRRWKGRSGWWRVFIDGRRASHGLFLGGGLKKRPAAAAEAFNTTSSACSRFRFAFRSVRTKTRVGRGWRAMPIRRIIEDPGYELIQEAPSAFVAQSSGGSVFNGDFETGDHSQWTGYQHRTGGDPADQFKIVRDPVRQGAFAAKFTVRPGDVFMSGGERSEVYWKSHEKEGDDYWYSWSTLFPPDWSAPSYFGIFLQWHSDFPYSPPIAFDARANTVQVKLNTGKLDSAGVGTLKTIYPLLSTLSKGEWNDFVVHMHWSLTNGSLTVWHRAGEKTAYAKVLDVNGLPTLQAQNGVTSENYIKQGLYRWTDPVKTDVLYQDAFKRAPTLHDLGLVENGDSLEAPATP